MPNASNVAEVEAIKGRLEGSVAALLTEYRGLKVAELGELRASLRGSSTEYRVLKNTLTSIAVREASYEELVGLLQASAQQTVNLLAAPLRQVATMTAALRDQKDEGPETTPVPSE